jgi:hypothetical protein
MNHEPDEKPTKEPSSGQHRTRPVLQVVRGERPVQEPTQPVKARREGPAKQHCEHGWDNDDPGPTAA